MVENLPPDYAKTVVYPVYREILRRASSGKEWTWCEVCPDAIVSLTIPTDIQKHMLISIRSGLRQMVLNLAWHYTGHSICLYMRTIMALDLILLIRSKLLLPFHFQVIPLVRPRCSHRYPARLLRGS